MGYRQVIGEALAAVNRGESAARAESNTARQIVAIPIIGAAPGDAADLLGRRHFLRRGAESEDEIVMQMVRLAPAGWDGVDVYADQKRVAIGNQESSSLLHHFAAGCFPDFGVARLDMSTGQQPAIQAAVMDYDERFARGMDYESGAGDMTGEELGTGERRGSVLKKLKEQFLALIEGLIARVGE